MMMIMKKKKKKNNNNNNKEKTSFPTTLHTLSLYLLDTRDTSCGRPRTNIKEAAVCSGELPHLTLLIVTRYRQASVTTCAF